ncbi:MAG TPA: hypothetical protein VNH38_02095 [Candidatus Dormibacteraeota bacterium]|nr:hypothetical protein [Candidatus Dormibacteraeota bacterium]
MTHSYRVVDRTRPGPTSTVIRETHYRLVVSSADEELTVETAHGRVYTRFPLVALAGRATVVGGVRHQVKRTASGLIATATTTRGKLISRATLIASPTFFTVSFEAALGPDTGLVPKFFDDGEKGLDWTKIRKRLSPDPRGSLLSTTPATRVGTGTSFSPPPFDLQLQSGPGWLGLGLVQVPDATDLYTTSDGSVEVNYPLATLAKIKDQGPGGLVGQNGGVPLLKFPSFVFTFSNGPWTGLTAYHSALQKLGYAPQAAPPGHRPSWWSWPLVDTWGQQMVDGAARTSPTYTSAWVRKYVAAWKARYGQSKITLVLDSQWQARIGEAQPSQRFGGVAGLRRLIAAFHAQGIHVLLWWPLWVLGSKCQGLKGPAPLGCATRPHQLIPTHRKLIDPTATSFGPTLLGEIRTLLGRGPAEVGADGLKIDWGQLTPNPNLVHLARPQLGVGAAALLRYLQMIYTDAEQVRRGALIESSAVAPQYGGTLDMIRLYDAWGEATWQTRAEIVSAVDPGTLIDGDDWAVQPGQAVAHAVSSSVYGTPASYFLSRWYDGEPISSAEARVLGKIMHLATLKGQGDAGTLPDGNWGYWVNGRLRAQTLGEDNALAVYSAPVCGQPGQVTVVSAVDQWLTMPGLKAAKRVRARAGSLLRLRMTTVACKP